jgi:hypothetical protein
MFIAVSMDEGLSVNGFWRQHGVDPSRVLKFCAM